MLTADENELEIFLGLVDTGLGTARHRLEPCARRRGVGRGGVAIGRACQSDAARELGDHAVRPGMAKGNQKTRVAHSDPDHGPSTAAGETDTLFYLRTKYSLLGKAEWWWLMDESLGEIHRRLETENFVVIDGFVPRDTTRELRNEIKKAHEAGHLTPGVLAGGKAGDTAQYTMKDVRGDHVGWFDGTETMTPSPGSDPLWQRLPDAMKRADTLVNELGNLGGEAKHVSSRSKAMCSVYPGAGARYVRHVDNPEKNGRLLTALLYLNPNWEQGDGGELRVFRCLRPDGADAGTFSDCDGNSLAVADGFSTYERVGDKGGNDFDKKTEVIAGPKDVAEGVRDVVTLRGGDDEDDDETKNKNKKKPVRLTDVAPLGGRLVLFKSDARVPHEVLASVKQRYAVTLWYFHAEEVKAARGGASRVTDEERLAQEEKIKKEIESMTLKYGGKDAASTPVVRTRSNQHSAWSAVTVTASNQNQKRLPPLPTVTAPTEVVWEDTYGSPPILVVRVALPAGTKASACSAEVEVLDPKSSRLVLRAPGGLPGDTYVELPQGADHDTVAVTLVKKPERALVVRVACPGSVVETVGVSRDDAKLEARTTLRGNEMVLPATQSESESDDDTSGNTKDCVGVGGMLHWSSETAFTPLPPLPTRFGKKTITRGVDLAGAVDWDDFATTRWCLAGADHERPTLTAHALDGLSFPITLAWATQQPAVAAAIHDAKLRGANSAADVRFAAAAAGVDDNATLGDGDLTLPPLTVLIAGASARTEQFLLEHTEYWNEFVVASPGSSGGAHLAFVGPDVDARKNTLRRLTSTLTASLHLTTVGAYLNRLGPTAPVLVIGFNTGLGGGGGDLARAWAPDLVQILTRKNTPFVLTCANEFADLTGERCVFKAIGARFIVDPVPNPFQAYTHAIGESAGVERDKNKTVSLEDKKQSSCANSFAYAVLGFEKGKGPEAGLRDDQLYALACRAAERAAGKAWDALGMRR